MPSPETSPEVPNQEAPRRRITDRLPPVDLDVPLDERWWEDPDLDRDQLLAGLAKYALARDSRYDRLAHDASRLAEKLDDATREVRQFREEAVRRDEVILPAEVHRLRRRTIVISALFAVVAVIASSLFLVGVVVPRCFFVAGGPRPSACTYIPGYRNAINESNVRLQQQRQLIEQIPQNRQAIDRLQREIDQLKARKP